MCEKISERGQRMSEPVGRIFVLEGSHIHDITSFYDEVNRVLMTNEDWTLGASLDALNDLLYGGYGELYEITHTRIVWRDHALARAALGRIATREYYEAKIARPEVFNVEHARRSLAELDAGHGPTYFDLVCEVFADHPEIRFDLA